MPEDLPMAIKNFWSNLLRLIFEVFNWILFFRMNFSKYLEGFEASNIILYGESLGTGIATHIAQNKNFAGLILETPFTSMVQAARNFYPYIPVGLILKDKYKNDEKIKNINIPVLVMHGEVDQIVPFWMGKKIFSLANDPKYSYFTKYDDHMMEYDEQLVLALNSFIESLN